MGDTLLDAVVFAEMCRGARRYGWGAPHTLSDGVGFIVKAEWSDFSLEIRRPPKALCYIVSCRFAVAPPTHRGAEIDRLVDRLNAGLHMGRFAHERDRDAGVCREEVSLESADRTAGESVRATALRLVKSCDEVFPAFHIVAWTGVRAEAAIDRTLYVAAGCA